MQLNNTKESLEQLATDIIISEYPEITQFRLKVIGSGGIGEAWSSDGRCILFIRFDNNGEWFSKRR